MVVPGFLTVSTSQPGSQYSTLTQGVDGLQKHGPVIVQETQARFTMPVKLGALALAWLPWRAPAPTATAPAAPATVPAVAFAGAAGGGGTTGDGWHRVVEVTSRSTTLLASLRVLPFTAKRLRV